MWCGILIVIAGVVLLGQNLGMIPYEVWEYVVPVLLILWGTGIIVGKSAFWCVPGERGGDEGRRQLDRPI